MQGVPVAERLMARLEQRGECWEWTGYRAPAGYGQIGKDGSGIAYTHRVAYEYFRAEIPEGLFIDHLCRNKVCCNPWHLEAVSNAENLRRRDLPEREQSELLRTAP